MSGEVVLDIAAAVCFLAGSFLSLAAGIGLLRFPDLLARMHAGTKPQVLGVLLGLAGYALRVRSWPVIWAVVLVAMFQLLTAPVSAHMVGRAGYRTGKVDGDLLTVDELTTDLMQAQRDRPSPEAADD
ncbi:MAG TPA: monovalent cation/H(+) antiporter subunit G [Acidimicrobiia bacterium]|nr:monovalent cation/H(+) antiporter subunit G [Acidimicrobiia bacterium]